ncbi:MAG: hypothetical protein A2854_00835 [Parcubacteria group bacterium RIFCSPHIGHO2_01_FULL_56_18]|nr:MAG: hypothetical protein A2854_00835 [Parcubacteria group bacterium RIFCSPHIGHO2_01_FULL_56_18]
MRYAFGTLIVFAALCAALLFFFNLKHETLSASLGAEPATTSLATAGPTSRWPPDGWREYVSTPYKFSIFYPADMKVSEYDEGSGAFIVTFENVSDVQGFQIFIVPYDKPQVSPERFKQDIPSGVRTDMQDVTIDGALGAAFYSRDESLGETREVWFVNKGYLYEVTTLKPLEKDLLEILPSWRFI